MKTSFCRIAAISVLAMSNLVASGCKSDHGVQGTYSDPSGAWVLDLKSGGKATLTFYGDSRPCNYTVNDDQISVGCQGEKTKLNFTSHQDGSLSGQDFMPVLKKSK